LIEGLLKELQGLRGRSVAILLHVGGDPDALASGYVLSEMLAAWSAEVRGIAVPNGASDQTEKMATILGIRLSKILPEANCYLAVDVGSPSQLASFLDEIKGEVIVVDHHEKVSEPFTGRVYCSPAYQSTSEIVLDLAEAAGYRLSGREASALFAGIYFDTVRLSVADPVTLRKVGVLGEHGADPRELLQRLESPLDYSERLARIRAVRRAEFYRVGDILIGFSRVGAFRVSAARAILALGAHIAIVGDENDGEVEVTLRQVPEMYNQLRLNLVKDVVEPILRTSSGSGGGHASAAKLRVRGEYGRVMELCLQQLSFLLGARPVRVAD